MMIKSKISFISLCSILFVLGVVYTSSAQQGTYNFPGEHWDYVENVEDLGYSIKDLEKAKTYSESINTEAVIIVVKGKILYEWGSVETKYNTHSIRKSFLSALYGNYVKQGIIDLDLSMEQLGIDDKPPLSEEEKKATIRDCLKARSGIYHPALYESAGMKALKPERFTEKAGIHWYYNNWDFNVSGTIFTKLTGKDIFESIKAEIADPIQMEDYSPEDGHYVSGAESIHRAYPFRVTARDLARFGLLMLNKGKWKEKQLIPKDWVEESTSYHSDATLYASDGYGYMWWVAKDYNKYPHLPGVELKEGTYSARGSGGHYVLVIPEYDMVIVHRVNTDKENNRVENGEFGKLVKLILESSSN
ncbi:serine hydrolase domain-containing protein [Flagellimonas nanhaiensis]|uniref:Class C beta-lactamase-related serine hydrolase n=1 Tax=Flagellimonas nanhaiensis TaxID=2292706 RepID=A0A371JQJ5_9FLAO|nr:serine hydrolase [Allomuricauda nanhaiensis]RDY59703.1 class C beta-lactamase-related serine hydrolase [Allomuricauda nanhaiensis]